jgi:hypothetical protein
MQNQDRYIHLIEVPLETSTFYFTTANADFEYLGITWLSGFIGTIPNIIQTSKIRENAATFVFHDLDGEITRNFSSQNWKGKKLKCLWVFLNPDDSIELTYNLYRETMDSFEYDVSQNSKTVSVGCLDQGAKKLILGRKTNNESIHELDPTDNCCEFTPFIQANQPWGREGSPTDFSGSAGTRRRSPIPPEPEGGVFR